MTPNKGQEEVATEQLGKIEKSKPASEIEQWKTVEFTKNRRLTKRTPRDKDGNEQGTSVKLFETSTGKYLE